jgi:hypothetical protein
LLRYTPIEDNYPDLIVGSTDKQPLLETPGEVHCVIAFLCEYYLLFSPSESLLSTAFVHLTFRIPLFLGGGGGWLGVLLLFILRTSRGMSN